MTLTKILCLANSQKLGGRCLAGLTWPDLETWIRPVDQTKKHGEGPNDRASGEVPNCRAKVEAPEGRRFIRPLDVISVDLVGCDDDPAQPENQILGPTPIILEDVLDPAEVTDRLRSVADTSSWVMGIDDGSRAIPESVASQGLPKSIALYEVDHLRFFEVTRHQQVKWKLDFRCNGRTYQYFPITDLDCQNALNRSGLSEFDDKGSRFLTISLGNLYSGRRWLLIAGVIPCVTFP